MKVRLSRSLALLGYFSLLGLMLAWHAWLSPPRFFPVTLVLLATAVPLLLPLRGLLHGRPRSHLWAAFLSLAYFTHGIGEAVASPEDRWLGVLEVACALLLFFTAVAYVRWAPGEQGREA